MRHPNRTPIPPREAAEALQLAYERIEKALHAADLVAQRTEAANDLFQGYVWPSGRDTLKWLRRCITDLQARDRENGSARTDVALAILAVLAGARLLTWAAMWAAHQTLVTLYATDYAAYLTWWERFVAWGLIIPK